MHKSPIFLKNDTKLIKVSLHLFSQHYMKMCPKVYKLINLAFETELELERARESQLCYSGAPCL